MFNNSRYWLNGREVYTQYSGYTRARFDITDAANFGGRNVLVVQVDPRYEGWWYEGGGIYRHARMVTLDPVHIAPDGVLVAPALADPNGAARATADIRIITWCSMQLADGAVALTYVRRTGIPAPMTLEISTNLEDWQPAVGVFQVDPLDASGLSERVSWSFPTTEPRLFLRLK
jgi:hypothetical protein